MSEGDEYSMLKVSVIGAGSTYTPELIEGFILKKDSLPISELWLMDIDEHKLKISYELAARMLKDKFPECKLFSTTALDASLDGADYVLAQIRVGGLTARIKDEKIPLKYEMIGQETTGIGGFMKAMRTIPVMRNIASRMKELCPGAFLVNFTNPSGLISEFLANHTDIRSIGLCNIPIKMRKWAIDTFAKDIPNAAVDYVGLNHLAWITGVYDDKRQLMEYNEKGFEDFSSDLVSYAKGYPCGYLSYYYNKQKQLHKLRSLKRSRGEECVLIEEELLSLYQSPELYTKPKQLEKRGGAMYSEAAVSLIDALYNDRDELHVVNVKNEDTLDFMAEDDVIEISCKVGKSGCYPISLIDQPSSHIKLLMKTIKHYEKLAVLAGMTGDYQKAVEALLLHPLCHDHDNIKEALDEMLDANKKYLPQFYDR